MHSLDMKTTFTKTEYLRFIQTNDVNRLFMLFDKFRSNNVRFLEDVVILNCNKTLPNDISTKCYLVHYLLYLADTKHGKTVECPKIAVREMVQDYEFLFRCEFSNQTEAFLTFDA
jgi:hypothetical protein